MPDEAADGVQPTDAHAAWPDRSGTRDAWQGQTNFPGTARAPNDAETDPATECDPQAEADSFLECLRKEMDIDGFGDVGHGDVSDVEGQQRRQQQRRHHQQSQRLNEEPVQPVWPQVLEPGRLAPSLQPADASEQRRLTREGQPSP